MTEALRKPLQPFSISEACAIGDYGLIGDCHAAALVSRFGSIDWCCMPRFDSDPCFGRLLDWERAGFCNIAPAHDNFETRWAYHEDTMVLSTEFHGEAGSATVTDFFAIHGPDSAAACELVRIVEGVHGEIPLAVDIQPRFSFGGVKPWIQRRGPRRHSAVGGNYGLIIDSDMDLEMRGKHALGAALALRPGQRRFLSLRFARPEDLEADPVGQRDAQRIGQSLTDTLEWWRRWSGKIGIDSTEMPGVRRSAILLKALSYAPTGAIIAAPTTSLPEGLKGTRNWDYRFSWVRDAAFTAHALVEVGCDQEAFCFRRFIESICSGIANQMHSHFGIDGGRRHEEHELESLAGYRGATPVRVGNNAAHQYQLDVFGETLELSWLWHQHGHKPSADYWEFLVDLVDWVCAHWQEPDHGIWEIRGEPQHYVHSKVMCWSALNRAIALAAELDKKAPIPQWKAARDAVRAAVCEHGYDAAEGVFVQAFGNRYLDAALLRLPGVGFIDYCDERMLRTTDAIRSVLDKDGLLRRYNSPDGLPGEEGAFLACSFWLAECLAYQDRYEDARGAFRRSAMTANALGLFSEQYDTRQRRLWSNYPQGLTHLSHITAALALKKRNINV